MNRFEAETTVEILRAVLQQGRYADKILESAFRQIREKSIQGSIATATYGCIRYFRLLQVVSGSSKNMWSILAAWLVITKKTLPNWSEWNHLDVEQMLQRFREAQSTRAIRESIPDWLDALGQTAWPSTWDQELKALNENASQFIRVNRLKTTRDVLLQQLSEQKIKASPIEQLPDGIRVNEHTNLFSIQEFQQGLFEIQDGGSQHIAPFLGVEPGMRVVDACAGRGGKTLHLAALMQNKGRLIAMDTVSWKLDELKKRARRAGVSNLELKPVESSKTIKRLARTADRVLLDVPCSGLGVLRRNPDAKWKLTADYLLRLQKIQSEILESYSQLVKPGGKLVYATCSILPTENEEQVKSFLATHSLFSLEEEKYVMPSTGFDGFYMARLLKKE